MIKLPLLPMLTLGLGSLFSRQEPPKLQSKKTKNGRTPTFMKKQAKAKIAKASRKKNR